MTPRPQLLLVSAASLLALLFGPCVPATAESLSGSDSRPVSSRVFAKSSPFYQKLPAKTPAASKSKKLVASLNSQAHKFYGTKADANVAVNTSRFSPALYVARNTDPAYDITGWNCQHKADGWDTGLNQQLTGIHLPADMKPDNSTDGSVSVYNPDTRELIELWKAQFVDGQWQACWGGRIADASQGSGTFPYAYGASASGLALWGATIRQSELLNGHIDHAISLAIPYTKRGTISWPANRTDGNSPGTQLAVGQKLRLPAQLDLSAMKLSPVALTIAKAAQEYGIIISDTSGSVAFSAENPIGLATNSYDSIFRGRWPYLEMLGNAHKGEVPFPLDKLVALPLDYQVPPTTAPGTANRTYAAAVKAAKPAINWRLDDTGSVAADSSGHKRTGTLVGVRRYVQGAISGRTAIQTSGDPTSGVHQTKTSKPARSFTVQVWFKTTTTSGGKLVGFENTKTYGGSRADRSLYLTNDGRVRFGTINRTIKTVASPESYNDGGWHQATATQGSDGTRLYLDGALVASSTVAAAQSGSGYWRLGGGNLHGWPERPASSYYAGSLDEFAYYGTALNAATIQAQYRAAA